MYRYIKRLLDIVLSSLGIIILSPLMLITAAAVRISSKGPALFLQTRVGRNNVLFNMLKFRSMYTDTPKNLPTDKLPDPDRHITPVGKVLRKTSLDELPQLFNIFIGHMSLIGPRPALANQTALLKLRDECGASSIRPGLTGWAQINGRDELPDAVKARYDGEYYERMSFCFDVKCFFMTIIKVAKSEGIIEGAKSDNGDSADGKEE